MKQPVTFGRVASAALATVAIIAVVAAGFTTAFAAPVSAAEIRFVEIGERAGVRHVHTLRNFGDRPKAQVLEVFTSGGAAVAVGDYDGDGYDDLFVTGSDAGSPNRLYRNGGGLTFTEVGAAVGVAGGNDELSIVADALWLDYDNDGKLDLLVGRFGTPLLYRNLGPGDDGVHRFEEVSRQAGLTAFGNTIGVITFDYDRDGWLDLMLGNYFQPLNLLDLETPRVLPNNLDNADNGGGVTLWHNVPGKEGERRFVEVTQQAGFAHHTGWTLDLGHADLDGDGWEDVYVAGDYGTDRLFMNRGDGTFADVTEKAIGFDTRKGMNVDFGDYNRDGWLDIFVTNITDEYMKECNMLWNNNGDGTLIDLSRETGTCDSDWGWAGKFGDFDNDGWEDIFTVNGLRSAGKESYLPLLLEAILVPDVDFADIHSYPDIDGRSWSGYQRQRLFQNLGDGTFKEVATAAGVGNDLDGRGIGVGDFDNDGRLDLYQTNAAQPALLYHNTTENAGHWVELELVGTRSNRNAIGARVIVHADSQTFLRELSGGNGYASQSTYRLHFGLGGATRVDRVEIRWPNGGTETLAGSEDRPPIPIDRITRIVEGKGVVPRESER